MNMIYLITSVKQNMYFMKAQYTMYVLHDTIMSLWIGELHKLLDSIKAFNSIKVQVYEAAVYVHCH